MADDPCDCPEPDGMVWHLPSCFKPSRRRSLLDDVIDRDLVIVWHDQDGAA